MMRYSILLIAVFFLFVLSCYNPIYTDDTPSVDYLEKDVTYLADDKLEGRETGTEGERMAAIYIADRFRTLNLETCGNGDTYIQPFHFKPYSGPAAHGGGAHDWASETGYNVLAYKDNPGDRIVIIGAHYDHLGHGIFGSLHTGEPAIHNGADDNASGVAVMLELAKRLSVQKSDLDFLFVAFSGEEMGLLGSNFYTENFTVESDKIHAMINLDMVGRLDESKGLAVNGIGTAPDWQDLLDRANKHKINLITTESGAGPSDHASFYFSKIPAIHIFTGAHEDYHKPTDDVEKINFEGMRKISDLVYELVIGSEDVESMVFQETEDKKQGREMSFSVTLGVMPDYLYSGRGMKLDGVKEGRPGKNAGLQKGDVIVGLGDMEIDDIYDYMEGLGKFKPGETVSLRYLREGEEYTTEVTF